MQENCTYLSSVLREFPKYDNLTSKVNPHIWVSQNESAFVSKLPLKFHRNSIPHAQINRKKNIYKLYLFLWVISICNWCQGYCAVCGSELKCESGKWDYKQVENIPGWDHLYEISGKFLKRSSPFFSQKFTCSLYFFYFILVCSSLNSKFQVWADRPNITYTSKNPKKKSKQFFELWPRATFCTFFASPASWHSYTVRMSDAILNYTAHSP